MPTFAFRPLSFSPPPLRPYSYNAFIWPGSLRFYHFFAFLFCPALHVSRSPSTYLLRVLSSKVSQLQRSSSASRLSIFCSSSSFTPSLSRPLIIVSQLEGPHRFVCSNEIDGEGMRRCRFKYSSAFRLSEELKKQNVVPPREM